MTDQRASLVRRIRILAGLTLSITGAALIVVSYFRDCDDFASNLLLSIGIEVGIAGLILLFLEYFLFRINDDFVEELKYYRELFKGQGILSETMFTTKIPDLCIENSLFHTYHMTRRDGKEVWMYNPVTLTKDELRMALTGVRKTINKHNMDNEFIIQAGLKGSSLIIFSKKESYGSEETVIDVIRDFSNANNQKYCGFRFHATWDKNYSVSPVLMTVKPFFKNQRHKPFVLNDSRKNTVETEWKKIAEDQKIKPLLNTMFE